LLLKDAIHQIIDGRLFPPMAPAIRIVRGRSIHS
jgi:hypothetical protein